MVGIFLFNKLSQINEWRKDHRWKPDEAQTETYVVQRYIENPLLVGGEEVRPPDLRTGHLVQPARVLPVLLGLRTLHRVPLLEQCEEAGRVVHAPHQRRHSKDGA